MTRWIANAPPPFGKVMSVTPACCPGAASGSAAPRTSRTRLGSPSPASIGMRARMRRSAPVTITCRPVATPQDGMKPGSRSCRHSNVVARSCRTDAMRSIRSVRKSASAVKFCLVAARLFRFWSITCTQAPRHMVIRKATIRVGTARRSTGSAISCRWYAGFAIDCANPLIESDWTHALAACARAMPLAPSEILLYPFSEVSQRPSESQRFESSFAELSRVNDSLMQKKFVHAESKPAKHLQGESERRTRGPPARIPLRVRWLGVADDPFHGRERAAQRTLDLVDVLVNLDHAHRRRGAAVEVHDFAGVGIAHPHAMDVMDRAIGGEARQRGLDGFDALRRGIAANRQFRLQRLDVGVDLDVLAEFLADVPLQFMGDGVGCGERHIAVNLEIDADGELAAEIVHGDVVDGETGIAGNHHDAFAHTLVVARDRHGGECQVGIAKRLGHRLLRPAFDLLDAVDRIGARHLYDGVNEVRRSDHPHPQPFDIDHAGHRPDRRRGSLRRAFGGAVEQSLHGGACQPQAQERDHYRYPDSGGGVTPGIA